MGERLDGERTLALFRDAGALLTGHFLLSSGLHSDQYLEKFRLVEQPSLLEPMCKEIAARFAGLSVECVLGPTTAGIILAYSVAGHLGVVARYAEPAEDGRELRRGQTLASGTRVLIVDDILTTGLSVRECLAIVQRHGAVLVGVGVLGDRSCGAVSFGVRLESLLRADMTVYRPGDCPLCRDGVPLTKPGTRK